MELARARASPSERLTAFRRSIAPDLFSLGLFVPWTMLDRTLSRLAGGVDRLQESVDRGLTKADLASALVEHPDILEVIRLLFSAPQGAGFQDGRELPVTTPASKSGMRAVASLAVDLGLRRMLPRGTSVTSALMVALIANDARSRGYRRRDAIAERIRKVFQEAIERVIAETAADIHRMPPSRYPASLRNRVDEVLVADGVPVAALATVLQAQTGGRQQRELAFTYPKLQEDLDQLPAHLILIADGKGLAETPSRIIRQLLESVAGLLTISQAESGELAESLLAAVTSGGARPGQLAIDAFITNLLGRSGRVSAAELPLPRDRALLELAQYQASRPNVALGFDPSNGEIYWENLGTVLPAQRLSQQFRPLEAAQLLTSLLQASILGALSFDGDDTQGIHASLPEDRVLPSEMVIAATSLPIDGSVVRSVARAARSQSADSSVAVLIGPTAAQWIRTLDQRKLQQSLASSVVVLGPLDLVRVAAARSPRDDFVRFVLEQADLSKANPFNYTGVTPREMFFGREAEVASLRAILPTNSAALLGGRRIGKTSLMQRAVESLSEDGWNAYYADCQPAGDWSSFASVLQSRWDVSIRPEFSPAALYELVSELKGRGSGPIVILLDEIDALLRWDQVPHPGSAVTEALFRTLRAISQERLAQFVFSGERLVADRLWDAASPHWNFCRPVNVQQLTRAATDLLISRPLQELGVAIADRDAFLDGVWAATQGHPRLVQFIGDRLVHRLNQREPEERSTLESEDVDVVVQATAYRGEYASTYWGQATPLERFMTLLVAGGREVTLERLIHECRSASASVKPSQVRHALRMLELYGIVEQDREPIELRAKWMPDALDAFGGVDSVRSEVRGQM